MTVSSTLRDYFPDGIFSAGCPSRTVLDHVTSKWGTLVILALAEGEPLRWSELRRRAEGVSEKMLAQTLRQLEADGLVHRDARPVVPPHVEYSLTDRGAGLAEHMVPLMAWIAAHAPAIVSDAATATSAASVTR
ncbi:winged helix-turn-helix transcriptional regulator [Humibacillus xanthopallidus]|uniref:HxlR family transcriptional regulator n=1 Tax=Humibacillus xanthopallidus TaxID=412689 RepID=A0A543I0M7_9MICO|nr:helix-turn-helix domain-containing protein [Humibacillus xanthopallidus]TQM64149.1 HxlR family transcriptional regulator [Humibacillus xanthopallidus]